MTISPEILKIPCPTDEKWHDLRSMDITASTAGALLDCHEFATRFSLFNEKTGAVKNDVEDSGPVRRGRLLEPVAVQVLREDYPFWTFRHNSGPDRVYYRDAAARLGCTPDIEAHDPARGLGVIQVKSVEAMIFRRKWCAEGEPTPPLWIAVQCMIEASLVGAQWGAVAPIVVGHGVDCPLIEIPLDDSASILARVRKEVSAFWTRVEQNDPPHPDFSRDGDVIHALYRSDNGSTIALDGWNAGPVIAEEDAVLAEEIKVKTARRKAIKAELLDKIGEAAVATINGRIFATANTISKKPYSVAATSYRDIRFKKGFSA